MNSTSTQDKTRSRKYRLRWWTLGVLSLSLMRTTIDETIPNASTALRFTQLLHSHEVTTSLLNITAQNRLFLPMSLPWGSLYALDDPITVINRNSSFGRCHNPANAWLQPGMSPIQLIQHQPWRR